MKKIGILTFHDTLNYGASMQCYALQEKLYLMGANVEVVNYRCPKFVKEYSPYFVSKRNIRKILYMLAALKMNVIKQEKKKKFQKKYIRLSREYTPDTIVAANEKYDAFITGSDQVWNWHLTDFDKSYFLDFVQNDKGKYSYAASFGISEIEEDKQAEYQKLLSGYSAISVREESGAKLLKEMINGNVEVVVDPVFLLSAEEWEKIAKKAPISGYVLLYSINDTEAYECAVKLAKRTKKKLVYLNAPVKRFGNFKKITNIGPDEFVGWFKSADYVVTDSFHGVVASILFEKQFIALQDRDIVANTNSRVWDLLNKIGLTDRIVKDTMQSDIIFEKIQYQQVKKALDVYIENSIVFLKKIIGDIHE